VLVALPLAMAAIAVALTAFGGALVPVGVLLAAWGPLGTAAVKPFASATVTKTAVPFRSSVIPK
jgi:hypothetical protein